MIEAIVWGNSHTAGSRLPPTSQRDVMAMTTKAGKSAAKIVKKATDIPDIDIGINAADRRKVADSLSHFLADSYTLYLKTHNYHWNITGPMFNSLHVMFEGQYTEEWTALDAVAERIRALGYRAPGSYAEFAKLSSIDDSSPADTKPVDGSDWREMVRQLVVGNEAVCRTARKVLKTADSANDDPTVDLMTQRLNIHEKNAWMLRSLLA